MKLAFICVITLLENIRFANGTLMNSHNGGWIAISDEIELCIPKNYLTERIRPTEVVFATQETPPDRAALHWNMQIQDRFAFDFYVVHVSIPSLELLEISSTRDEAMEMAIQILTGKTCK